MRGSGVDWGKLAQVEKFFEKKVDQLAKANNVVVTQVSECEIEQLYIDYGRPSASGIFIVNGSIQHDENPCYELIFHELLHILSVPVQFRHLMHIDTERSYKAIRMVYKDKRRLCTESAVLGLQAFLYRKMDAQGWIGGAFFRGHLRRRIFDEVQVDKIEFSTDVKREWVGRGIRLAKEINWEVMV